MQIFNLHSKTAGRKLAYLQACTAASRDQTNLKRSKIGTGSQFTWRHQPNVGNKKCVNLRVYDRYFSQIWYRAQAPYCRPGAGGSWTVGPSKNITACGGGSKN